MNIEYKLKYLMKAQVNIWWLDSQITQSVHILIFWSNLKIIIENLDFKKPVLETLLTFVTRLLTLK